TLSRGDAVLPLRSLLRTPDGTGLLGLMPAFLGTPACMGIKVISVYFNNDAAGLDSHQGAVLLFEPQHGSLVAMIDASSITGIRTAAVSGAATRALAREDAGDLALIGAGVQAITHLEAMLAVRTLRRVRVWSLHPDKVRAFAERESKRHGIHVEPVSSARAAVEGADIVCTTTGAKEPVVNGDWLAPGAHINAVGACFPNTRELDTNAVVRSRLFVDRRESALNEAGDFLIPKHEGAIGDDHIVGELGDVFLGTVPGRRSSDEITLFKSLGIAVEDLAAAHHIWRKARASGTPAIDFGGHRIG
ncbi:MAG TPA: ornithine cyclodeaminase family protein, partial [Candidatus Krumholzibacteria bacterium]|nr:ornithine cyclodeaminase family protein [Candidatus Krumholzibacteria bacterium]